MNVAVADTEYANIRGAYGYLGVEPLTTQQEMMLLTHLRGMSIRVAAQAAGMSTSAASALMKEPRIEVIKDFFRAQLFTDARIDLNMLNNMALEAHRKSANATEELKAIDTLAKLNQVGGFASAQALKEQSERGREREVSTPRSLKELEHLPQDKLMELADFADMGSLDPEPVSRSPVGERADDNNNDVIEGELV